MRCCCWLRHHFSRLAYVDCVMLLAIPASSLILLWLLVSRVFCCAAIEDMFTDALLHLDPRLLPLHVHCAPTKGSLTLQSVCGARTQDLQMDWGCSL